jgi:alkanesulfonate monooxygenase SsuD/methylene tetrahydromethanopterin reductase-like flavin-dependent oxidoreductase (luciferase family)
LELAVGAGGSAFDHALAQVERWPPADRARRFEAFVARLLELLARDDLQPRPAQARIPLTVGGNGRSVLRVAARHADRWNTYVGWQLPREEGRRLTRERNAELDRLCREAGRDPRTLLRSALIGHSFVAETPFASQHAFREFCLAYEDAGIDELIVYWPPEFAMPEDAFEPGLFERLFG